MEVKLRRKKIKDGESLYLDINLGKGKRYKEYLKLHLKGNKGTDKHNLELAEKIRVRRQNEINSGIHKFQKNETKNTDLFEYLDVCMNSATANVKSYRSLKYNLNNFLNGNKVTLKEFDKQKVLEFKDYLASRLAPSTGRGMFAAARLIFKKAFQDELIEKNPFELVKNFTPKDTKREYLTIEELKILKETPCSNSEVKRAFLFSCFTGLRKGDVYNLRWNDIRKDGVYIKVGKTKEPLKIPLNETAKNLLGVRQNDDSKVFKLPVSATLSVMVKAWVNASGINKNITYHCSRHTFATLSLNNDIPIYTVSKLLGHSRIETTQVYANLIDKTKEDAVNKLPSL